MRAVITYICLALLANLSGAVLGAGTASEPQALQAWAKKLSPDRTLAVSYVEMVEVDGINRRGTLRFEETGKTESFAMIPAGTVQYRGGYTDIRYITAGSRMLAFIEASETGEPVYVHHLADDLAFQMQQSTSYAVVGVEQGKTVRLTVAANRTDKVSVTADSNTVVWKDGKEGTLADLQSGQNLKINFKAGEEGKPRVCAEIWTDTASAVRAVEHTRTNYVRYLTLRGLPAQVGATTRDTLVIRFYRGADQSLKDQFKQGTRIHIAAADERLRTYGQEVDRVGATVQKVESVGDGRGGETVQLTCHARVMLEGFRPGRSVRAWAEGWPVHGLPREERLYPWDFSKLPDIGNLPKEPMLSLPFALPIPPR